MPTVPRAQQQVSAAPLPGARVTTQAPEGAFGGPDLSGPTRALASYAAEERDKADQVAVNGAVVQAHDLREQTLYDPQTGALNQKGANALGSLQTAREAWQSGVSQISGSLQNDRQREAFAQHAVGMYEDLSSRIESHAHDEFQKADESTTKARLAIADKDAIDNVANPGRRDFAIQQKGMIVADYGKRQGWSPEAIQVATTKALSDAHMNVLEHFLDTEQDMTASAYLAAHRSELTPNDLNQADKLTEAGSVRAESQRLSDYITKNTSTLTDALAQVQQTTDPRVRDQLEIRVRRHFQDVQADRNQERADAFQSASAILEQSGGNFERIPLKMRLMLTPEENGALQRRSDQIRNPERTTNPQLYMSMLNAAGLNDWTRQAFAQMDLGKYRNSLSESDFNRVLGLQLSVRQQQLTGQASEAKYTERREATAEEKATQKRLQQSAAVDQAVALATASEKDPTKRAAIEHTLRATLGAHVTPAVPGAPITSPITAPIPNIGPSGNVDLNAKPVAPTGRPAAPGTRVPSTWVNEAKARRDPAYRQYLAHIGVHVE